MDSEFVYQKPQWPHFIWDQQALAGRLASLRLQLGRLQGRMAALGFESELEAQVQAMSEEAATSSRIEGEELDLAQVRSSVARSLGVEGHGRKGLPRDREGLVSLLVDATRNFAQPVDEARLQRWHLLLFEKRPTRLRPRILGAWRSSEHDPMQVISGATGHESIHFEAPPAAALPLEMQRFIAWFNAEDPPDPLLKSGLAQLWFLTLHPFEDGNGRIARALSECLLARSEGSERRFYSLSWQIQSQRSSYYEILERTQRGDMDVSAWLQWYLDALAQAIASADQVLHGILHRAEFWRRHTHDPLNPRQRAMLALLLSDFKGKLSSSKWAKLQDCSQDTAIRDIQALVKLGILVQEKGGGRSTSYRLET